MAGQYSGDEYIDEGLEPVGGPTTVLGIELTPPRIGLLIGGVGVLAAFLLGLTQLLPLFRQIQQLEEEVAQKQADLQSTEQQIASLQDVPDQLVEFRAVNEQVSSLLPNPDNVTTQLIDLNRLVQQSDSELESYTPSAPRPASVEGSPEVPQAIANQIQIQNASINLLGEYEDVIALMNNIERLETLIRVRNLGLSFAPNAEEELQATFEIVAYVYDDTVVIPVEGEAGEAAEGETEEAGN